MATAKTTKATEAKAGEGQGQEEIKLTKMQRTYMADLAANMKVAKTFYGRDAVTPKEFWALFDVFPPKSAGAEEHEEGLKQLTVAKVLAAQFFPNPDHETVLEFFERVFDDGQ